MIFEPHFREFLAERNAFNLLDFYLTAEDRKDQPTEERQRISAQLRQTYLSAPPTPLSFDKPLMHQANAVVGKDAAARNQFDRVLELLLKEFADKHFEPFRASPYHGKYMEAVLSAPGTPPAPCNTSPF